MSHIDQIIADALAGSPETHVAIPTHRVLGDGMVHVSREELEALRECAGAVLNSAPEKTWSRNDTCLTRAARKISAIRANQGGAAT